MGTASSSHCQYCLKELQGNEHPMLECRNTLIRKMSMVYDEQGFIVDHIQVQQSLDKINTLMLELREYEKEEEST